MTLVGDMLLTEMRGGTLVVTINGPPMNAIGPQVHEALHQTLLRAGEDNAVKVIVLTGAGDTAFSAGGDLKSMADDIADPSRPLWSNGMGAAKSMLQLLLNLPKPLISRVNGHAMGLGATIAVMSDFSIMVDDAKIGDNHVKVGLAAGDGGALLWPLLMGFAQARRYLLTGDLLSGSQAADAGLITQAVPREELDDVVYSLADSIESGATKAINNTKIAINLLLRSMVDNLIEAHFGLEVQSALSADHREAVDAFLSKREPAFTGN